MVPRLVEKFKELSSGKKWSAWWAERLFMTLKEHCTAADHFKPATNRSQSPNRSHCKRYPWNGEISLLFRMFFCFAEAWIFFAILLSSLVAECRWVIRVELPSTSQCNKLFVSAAIIVDVFVLHSIDSCWPNDPYKYKYKWSDLKVC